MPELDVTFFTAAVLFGALMGYALGRNAEDRLPTVTACVVCAVVGVVSWTVGAAGTTPEVAGASMTCGGLTALLVLITTGRSNASTA